MQHVTAQQRDEGVKNNNHSDILGKHFCWAIVGAPGCGKTTYIQNLLHSEQFYKNKFDYIFVISPSNIKISGVDSECIAQTLKIDWLYERINFLVSKNVQNNNLLIVLDDCVSQIKQFQNDKMLVDLFFNRRHIWPNNTISLIITTQQFTMMPLRFRAVCDYFTFLSLSPRDFDFIKKELIYSTSRKCMSQIVETFQGQPYQFIYIRLQPFLLCQNFKPMIRGSAYVCLSNDFESVQQYKTPAVKQETKQSTTPQPMAPTLGSQLCKTQMFSFSKR